VGVVFKKLGGEVDGRIEEIVAGLSRLMMGIPKKKKREGCLSASFRSESSSPGRAISYLWRAIFHGCIMQGRKTAKGSKNRIENRSHHHRTQSFLLEILPLGQSRAGKPKDFLGLNEKKL
jgi:hypothetical protein